jgi:hypothetical protein
MTKDERASVICDWLLGPGGLPPTLRQDLAWVDYSRGNISLGFHTEFPEPACKEVIFRWTQRRKPETIARICLEAP